MNWSFEFFPFFPVELLAVCALLCLAVIALSAWRNRRGVVLRTFSLACLLAALANPNLKNEDRNALSNIAVVVADESSSMRLAGRGERARQIEADLKDKLAKIPNLDVRWVHAAGTDQPGGEATNLFGALDSAHGRHSAGPHGGRDFHHRRANPRCAARQ